jgi:hypothetical protein
VATAQKTVFFATDRFSRLYTHTPEERAHFSRSQAIAKYLERKATASPGSATTYGTHLRAFAQYIYRKDSKVEVDTFIEKLKRDTDLYDELAGFASFLKMERMGSLSGNILQSIISSSSIRSMRYHS